VELGAATPMEAPRRDAERVRRDRCSWNEFQARNRGRSVTPAEWYELLDELEARARKADAGSAGGAVGPVAVEAADPVRLGAGANVETRDIETQTPWRSFLEWRDRWKASRGGCGASGTTVPRGNPSCVCCMKLARKVSSMQDAINRLERAVDEANDAKTKLLNAVLASPDVQSIAFASVPPSVFPEFGRDNPLAFAGDVLTQLDMWHAVKTRGKTATVRDDQSPLFRACRDGRDTAPMQGKLLKSCRGSTRMLLVVESCSAAFKFNDLRDSKRKREEGLPDTSVVLATEGLPRRTESLLKRREIDAALDDFKAVLEHCDGLKTKKGKRYAPFDAATTKLRRLTFDVFSTNYHRDRPLRQISTGGGE
jgi:hypothetical protein